MKPFPALRGGLTRTEEAWVGLGIAVWMPVRLRTARDGGTAVVARLLINQPERVAAAWRRARKVHPAFRSSNASSLDDVVVPFLRELGLWLSGKAGSPWGNTRGVLRISWALGPRLLYDEFAILRFCLDDALEVLGAEPSVRNQLHSALDEAVDSSVALWQHLASPASPLPTHRPRGVVVAVFEKPPKQAARRRAVPGVVH